MKNSYDHLRLLFTRNLNLLILIALNIILQFSLGTDITAQSPTRTRLYTHPENFDAYNKIYSGYIDGNLDGHIFFNDSYIPVVSAEVHILYEQYWQFETYESVIPAYMFELEGATFPWQGWLWSIEKENPQSVYSNSEGYFVFGSGSSSNDIYLNYTGDNFTVSGTVTDSTEAPIPETNINLYTGTYKVAETLTDNDGNFQLLNILPSSYTLIAEKENYAFQPDSIIIELSNADISGIEIIGKSVKPFQVWILPNFPGAGMFYKTGIIPADKNFPAKLFAKVENELGEPVENYPVTFTLQHPDWGELKLDNIVEQSSMTVSTNEEGIASCFYHFTGQINENKIVEQISIKDDSSENEEFVTIEIGLGLEIYDVYRYETETGLIVSGTHVGMVAEIESSENFQTEIFDIEAYLDSIALQGIWENPFGIDLSFKWLNKPAPSIWGSLVSLFWKTEDEVYNGYCGFDNLRDLNTSYDFNILYAHESPKIEYGNLHSLPAIIPHSEGNHLYEISASISGSNNQGEYVRIEHPIMQIDVTGTSSDIELFLCALTPTTKTQFVVTEIFKNYNSWGGPVLDLASIACKIYDGNYFEAVLDIAKSKGDSYLGALKEKKFDSDFLQSLSENELAEVYKAILFKDAADFYFYVTGIQALDSILCSEKNFQTERKLMAAVVDVSDMEYQNLANTNIIGMLQNEENINSRIIAVVNAEDVNIKNSNGDIVKEIDYDFENINEAMKTTVENVTCFTLSGDDSYNLELTTSQNTSISTCKAGDLVYDLFMLNTDQNTKGTLEVSASEFGSLNFDYNNDGTIDEVI